MKLILYVLAGIAVLSLISNALNSKRSSKSRGLAIEAVASQATEQDVRRLLKEGKKIEAIKVYRELNPRAGLKEAKEAVERLEN